MAALLQSVRDITLSNNSAVEAAVAVDWTGRLQEAALAGRVVDAHGMGSARVSHVLSPANARAAVDQRLAGPLQALGLLDPEDPLRFKACRREESQRGCKRCCLEELYQQSEAPAVAQSGRALLARNMCSPGNGHQKRHRRCRVGCPRGGGG